MRTIAFISLLIVALSGCSAPEIEEQEETQDREQVKEAAPENQKIPLTVDLEGLYGDWVLIGVGADRMGPGVAPYGEILFAFRENGIMTVATEGKEELAQNLAGIPSPYIQEGTKLCSDDIVFKLQFKQECCEVIRLDEGRMSIEIEIDGGSKIYKHFVKLED